MKSKSGYRLRVCIVFIFVFVENRISKQSILCSMGRISCPEPIESHSIIGVDEGVKEVEGNMCNPIQTALWCCLRLRVNV